MRNRGPNAAHAPSGFLVRINHDGPSLRPGLGSNLYCPASDPHATHRTMSQGIEGPALPRRAPAWFCPAALAAAAPSGKFNTLSTAGATTAAGSSCMGSSGSCSSSSGPGGEGGTSSSTIIGAGATGASSSGTGCGRCFLRALFGAATRFLFFATGADAACFKTFQSAARCRCRFCLKATSTSGNSICSVLSMSANTASASGSSAMDAAASVFCCDTSSHASPK